MDSVEKERISTRVINALVNERLSKAKAGFMLGIKPPYLSWLDNPNKFWRVPVATWEVLKKWESSLLSIEQYSIATKQKPSPTLTDDLRIKIRPGVKEARELELKQKKEKISDKQLVGSLLKRREELKQAIDAIDVVLKYLNNENMSS